MSVLVDTGVLVAQQNQRDSRHKTAQDALRQAYTGRLGQLYVSDYILDEAVTLAWKRTRSHDRPLHMLHHLLGRAGQPNVYDVLMVTGPIFKEAVRVFEQHDDQGLSFTDATTVAFVRRRGIDQVLSFDTDFDGIVPRIDPGNLHTDN